MVLATLAAPYLACAHVPGFVTLASTTSTDESGLFVHPLRPLTAQSGIAVRVVAVGTGQALALGMHGDADVLLVHDRAGEDRFVSEGYGVDRRDVMYNDFVVVGPQDDPAGIEDNADAKAAFRRIAASHAPFASCGDDSGTNRTELRLWQAMHVDPRAIGPSYRELGQGMGPTLNAAAALGAYTLTDRATWANFRNRQTLTIFTVSDPALFNPYGSILVNSARFPTVKTADAHTWHEWLTKEPGRAVISSYQIGGEQLFFPSIALTSAC